MNPADRLALSDLVHRYAAGVDDRRFADVADLFDGDATLTAPDPPRTLEPAVVHTGRTDIGRALGSVASVERTTHAIVGEVYTVEHRTARGRISCIAHHFTRDENIVWYLRYEDEYVRTDAGWRFASRTLTIDAIETRPVRRLRPPGS